MKPHKGIAIGADYGDRGPHWSLGFHTGDDWLTPVGTPAYAMTNGTVHSVSYNSSYGWNVIVSGKNAKGKTVRWSINHCNSRGAILVTTGQRVQIGQKIAYTGATGNVTGPHDHVETRVAPYTFSKASFIDPQSVYDVKAPVVTVPKWVKPKRLPKLGAKVFSHNLAGYNDYGRATFLQRFTLTVAYYRERQPDVVLVQELPGEYVAEARAMLARAGFVLVNGGTDGRWIVRNSATTTWNASGNFEMRPELDSDDKQGAWADLHVRGADWLFSSIHTENQKAKAVQVGQVTSALTTLEGIAGRRDLGKDRIIVGGDVNSTTVRVDALYERGYMDAHQTAFKIGNAALRSTRPFGTTTVRTGQPVDLIAAYRTRPFRYYATHPKSAFFSDHLIIEAHVGLMAA